MTVVRRFCESCAKAIEGRRDRRFCSPRCRVAALRARRGDWRVAAAQLELGWPETWGATSERPDAFEDVFGDVDDSIATLLADPTELVEGRTVFE